MDARRGDPLSQRRGSRGSRRLDRSRGPMRAARGALPAGRHQARRGRRRGRGRRAPLARPARRKIEAIDTTGAGDAFVAAFLAARLNGADIQLRSSAPPRPAPPPRRSSGDGRERERSSQLIDPIASHDRLADRRLYLSSPPARFPNKEPAKPFQSQTGWRQYFGSPHRS